MKLSALYQIFLDCAVVTTDSRNCPAGSLFIALKGESFNGNAFAAQALKDGCAYAIVDEAEYAPENDRHFLRMKHLLRNCQAFFILRFFRHHYSDCIEKTGLAFKFIDDFLADSMPLCFLQQKLTVVTGNSHFF